MTSALFQLTENAEPIPGYKLVERIGAGGYGEVWKATAPGGLPKAVKFIFGCVEESRAARELKSLNRVRGLTHPFLLSLERIETVGDHLVVVTELADGSLRELFQRYVERGRPGIPREEMLRYLAEAADALDYLFESQSLQHLDVKPENLLVLGGHLKVADFGLLKDLHDAGASLVNGLTPKYAAPEVFDGQPSRNSDQYSLAIVYQEMLTGVAPFNGRTAAQLASQHLHSEPDLSPLTPHERFAVGRALSKNPAQRFASCREFVDRLTHRAGAAMFTGHSPSAAEPTAPDRRSTDALQAPGEPPAAAHDGQTMLVSSPETRSLPAIDLGDAEVTYRPTVFIGIGGTGAKVLCRLRQFVGDRFGDVSQVPALQFLLVDTDIGSIKEAVSAGGNGSLQESEAVLLPLRNTWDYRSEELGSLDSISRRWIYNIPRSLRTQGLRALGRLALLDNVGRLLENLRSSILNAAASTSVTASTEATQLPFRQADPRVFIVASLAGGTGGGMIIDLAYAVRQILVESGLSDDDVLGLLTYSNSSGPMHRELSAAGAFACLDEMRYFSKPGRNYPGEPLLGLAGFSENAPPLRHTYFLDLGDDLSDDDFGTAVDRVARYLFLGSVAPASAFFDKCRRPAAPDADGQSLRLRTFGLSPFGAEDQRRTSEWVELLCRSVVRKWRGGIDSATRDEHIRVSDIHRLLDACSSAPQQNADIESLAKKHASTHGMTWEAIAAAVGVISNDTLGRPCDDYFRDIISESLDKTSTDNGLRPVIQAVLRTIDTIADVENASPAGTIQPLGEAVFPKSQDLGRRMGADLQQWILSLVDITTTCLHGARQAGEWIRNYLQALRERSFAELRQLEKQTDVYRQTLTELGDDSKTARRVKRNDVENNLLHYARLKVNVLTAKAACRVIAAIEPYVTAASDELRDFWRDLNRLSETFQVAADEPSLLGGETPSPAGASAMPLAEVFDRHLPAMIESLDQRIKAELTARNQTLRQMVNKNAQLHTGLIAAMRSAARHVVLQKNKEVCLANLRAALKDPNDDRASQLTTQWIENAVPDLRLSGGAKRLLVAATNADDGAHVAQQVHRLLQEEVTVSLDGQGELIACCEVEDLADEGITARFLSRRPDCREIAARLHTRIDIDWRL